MADTEAATQTDTEAAISPTGDERLDDAAEAFAEAIASEESPDGDDSDLEQSLDAIAAAQDGEATSDKDDAAETAEGEETAAEAKEDEGEEPPAEAEPGPKEGEKQWEFAQARRMKRQAERQMDELRQMAADLKAQQDALAAVPDPRTDPIGYAEAVAQRAGMSRAALLEKLTGAELRDGEPDPMSEVAAVRAELDALKAAREEEVRRAQQTQAQRQQQAEIDGAVGEAMRLHDPDLDPAVAQQAAERWPWVSRAKPEAARHEMTLAARAVYTKWQRSGELHLHDQSDLIAEAADLVEDRYASAFGAPPAKDSEDRDTSQARDGQGTPDAKASKPAGNKPRSLTNRDAATGGTARRVLEGDERLDYAAAAFFE